MFGVENEQNLIIYKKFKDQNPKQDRNLKVLNVMMATKGSTATIPSLFRST